MTVPLLSCTPVVLVDVFSYKLFFPLLPLPVTDVGFVITCILKCNFIPGPLKSWPRLPFGFCLFVLHTETVETHQAQV